MGISHLFHGSIYGSSLSLLVCCQTPILWEGFQRRIESMRPLGRSSPLFLVGAVLTAKSVEANAEGVKLEQLGRPFATEVAPTGLARFRGWLRRVLFSRAGRIPAN